MWKTPRAADLNHVPNSGEKTQAGHAPQRMELWRWPCGPVQLQAQKTEFPEEARTAISYLTPGHTRKRIQKVLSPSTQDLGPKKSMELNILGSCARG